MNNKILIVEDDPAIAEYICTYLEKNEFDPVLIRDFARVIEEFESESPDLVLMDVALPTRSGYHWCKELRKISEVPVVFLTSFSDKMNILTAMDLGADDYITKPFDMSVLVAKIRAVMRRTFGQSPMRNSLTLGKVSLIINSMRIRVGEKEHELSKNEFLILSMLIENAGKPVFKADIMERIWQGDEFIDDNTLNVNINRLRKRLASFGLDDYILTVKGQGYMVNESE